MNKNKLPKSIILSLCFILCLVVFFAVWFLCGKQENNVSSSVSCYSMDFTKTWTGQHYPLDTLPKGDGNDVFPDEESFLKYANWVLKQIKKNERRILRRTDLPDVQREYLRSTLEWEIRSISLDENLGVWCVYFNTPEYTGDSGQVQYYSMKTGEYLGYETPE